MQVIYLFVSYVQIRHYLADRFENHFPIVFAKYSICKYMARQGVFVGLFLF